MIPIPQDHLERIVRDSAAISFCEMNMENYGNVDHMVFELLAGYDIGSVSAFTDDLADPKSLLILREGRSWVSPAKICSVMLFWVNPDHRNNPALAKDMFKTIDAFVEVNNCDFSIGSSWVYEGAKDISVLWASQGYDLQQKVFIKTRELNG